MGEGFRIPIVTAMLKFEGTDYDGAEIVVRTNLELGFYLDHAGKRLENPLLSYLELAQVVQSWNLQTPDGEPVPVTEEGIKRLPEQFCVLISDGWSQAVTEVRDPLALPAAP